MKQRQMRLRPELVGKVPPASGHYSAENFIAGRRIATDEDHQEMVRDILGKAPSPESVWVFAYGSLIWNPCFESVEQRPALVNGWHRSFCLGWDHWFRGSVERPGLMLALDRGGRCRGVAYRLPPHSVEENLVAIVKREVHLIPHPFPPRWINLVTAEGVIRAVTFVIDRRSEAYVHGLTLEEQADVLAVASGPKGSMAEYLFNTVAHLEERALHDKQLWALQDLVASRIEAMEAAAGQRETA